LEKTRHDFPKISTKISTKIKHENVNDYTLDDFEWLTKYEYHSPNKMEMVA
jgi:hypothetical protein